MEVQGLLNLVLEYGGRVAVVEGHPKLIMPSEEWQRKKLAELVPDLVRLRAEIIRHFQGSTEGIAGTIAPAVIEERPVEECNECEATVYTCETEVVRLCHMVMCPYWKKGCTEAPEWFAEERNKEEYRRRGQNKGRKRA